MNDYTIFTENYQINTTADRFSKDAQDDLYLYTDNETAGHIPASALEGIVVAGGGAA